MPAELDLGYGREVLELELVSGNQFGIKTGGVVETMLASAVATKLSEVSSKKERKF